MRKWRTSLHGLRRLGCRPRWGAGIAFAIICFAVSPVELDPETKTEVSPAVDTLLMVWLPEGPPSSASLQGV
jgi:hypothetical protein